MQAGLSIGGYEAKGKAGMERTGVQTETGRSQALGLTSSGILQRQCACGTHTMGGGQCAGCAKKKSSLQRKLTIGASNDPLEQEADRVADQVIAAPAHSYLNGIPPRIQRVTGHATGQTDLAPASVDRVLASPGRPLEPSLQHEMGQRFGYDFSRVRVHADRSASQSALAVNAKAYTVGHDIVFGAGRFTPGTNNGKRLLAHELAHVVQQGRADRKRAGQSNEKGGLLSTSMLVRKAEVDLPGWGSPLVGHDDSDVIFTTSGDFRTMDFQRDLAALTKAKVDPLAVFARKQQALSAGQWVHSEMEEEEGYAGTLRIKAGTKGTVEISVKAHFFFDEKVNDTYDQIFACSWSVEADLKGKLKFGRPRPQITPIGDDEAPFQLAGLNPDQDQDAGSVQISPQFNSYQFTDIPNVNIGGNIDIGRGGKGGVSGGVTFGNEKTFPPGVLIRTFRLELQVIDIPPPQGKVVIGPISVRRPHLVIFPPPKNRKGQDTVTSAQQRELISWYQGLNSRTREQIESGMIPISLEGHASTTGDPAMNLKLSDGRVEHVKRILGLFAGNRAVFNYRAVGEYEAKTPDDIESEVERTLVVSVWEQTSEGESQP